MRVFVFFGFRHFVRRCCAVFSYEFIRFLEPECFFMCGVVFSYEFITVAGYIEYQLLNFYGAGKKNKYIECCPATRPLQILMKKVLKFFPAFGKLLVLANAFFYSNSKVLKNWLSQLLARSWFWWMLFSIEILIKKSIEKLIFPAFGKSLVLANAFFYSNSNWKHWKVDFLSFWQDLGFVECFFLFKF